MACGFCGRSGLVIASIVCPLWYVDGDPMTSEEGNSARLIWMISGSRLAPVSQ